MIGQYLVYKLSMDQTISAAVGNRITPMLEDGGVLPAIVYELETEPILCMSTVSKAYNFELSVTVWSLSYKESALLGKRVNDILDNQTAIYDNIDIDSLYIVDTEDVIDTVYEPVIGSSQSSRMYGFRMNMRGLYNVIG